MCVCVCVVCVRWRGPLETCVVCVYQSMWCCRCTVSGCTGSSSLSGLVIGVLSVSWSSELLLNFSAPKSTFTPLLMRTTSSPLTHDQHTQCYWTTLYIVCMLSVQCACI